MHLLKTWPSYFQKVVDGLKRYEVRSADRDFSVDDQVILAEWRPFPGKFTGRVAIVIISAVTRLDDLTVFGWREVVARDQFPPGRIAQSHRTGDPL